MVKTREVIAVIVISLACGVSAQVAADEIGSGWYLGVDLGHVKLPLEDRGLISDKDLTDSASAVHGGYRFGRYIAVETSYADMGDFSYGGDFLSISGRRIDLVGVGSIPLAKRFDVYAKVGLARTELEYEERSLNYNRRFTHSNTGTIYGVGLRMHFDTPWSLRLQWDRTQFGYYQPDVDAWWFGAEYRFGSR